MASTLLIIGLTLFLMGTVMLATDAQQRGRSSLMFALPLAGASYIHQYWSDVWLAALLRVLGVTLVVMAAAVAIARDPLVLEQPQRLFGVAPASVMVGSKRAEMNTFANSHEAVMLAIRSDGNPMLSGQLRGRDFLYSEARLVNGVLTVQQGEGFIPEMEVRVLLDIDAASITKERTSVYVRPADDSAPELHISRRDRHGVLQTEIIHRGYQMELQLTRIDSQTLAGFLQVILPDPDRSYLSGEMTVRTNHLRFINGRVDLAYDHPDTLEYVGRQYLETQYPENTLASVRFRDTRLLLSESGGESTAIVSLRNGRVESRRLQFDRADIGWAVKPGAVDVVVLQAGDAANVRLIVPGSTSGREPAAVAEVPAPVDMAFASLDALAGQQAVVFQRDGRQRDGILRGLRRNRLMLESMVVGGTAEFSITEQELSHLVLGSGQQINIVPAEAATENAAVVVSAPTAATAAPAPSSADEVPAALTEAEMAGALSAYRALVGKPVTITSRDKRVRSGVLTAVSEREITLTVRVGARNLEYFYPPADVVSLVESSP